MKNTTIKSPLSNNYYTNFNVINEDTVEYDLIDARRGTVSRHYIYRKGCTTVVSLRPDNFERTIKVRNMYAPLLVYVDSLLYKVEEEEEEEVLVEPYDNIHTEDTFTLALVLVLVVVSFLLLVVAIIAQAGFMVGISLTQLICSGLLLLRVYNRGIL